MANEANRVILGVDPGLNITGYAVVELSGRDYKILEAGAIRTDSKSELPQRIEEIHAGITEVLREHSPRTAAIEKLYAHYKHPRTAILMAHARGAVMLACRQERVEIMNLSATNIKKALTGNGHASKSQVQRAIQAICNLPQIPSPPDVADALAVALCASRR